MSGQKFKAEQVADALQRAGGVIAVAARALGCDRGTVYAYMRRYTTVQQAYDEANETNLDVAEAGLAQFMRGQVEGMTTRERLDALKFYLRTKGRARGYGDRVEHAGTVNVALSELTDEELAAVAAGEVPARLR